MVTNKLIAAAIALSSATMLNAWGGAPAPSAAALTDPCAPDLSAPKPPPSSGTAPAAPKNVRIVGGGGDLEPEFEFEEPGSGPFVGAEPAAMAGHAYFDMLAARGDCLVAYHLRTADQINAVETSGKSDTRYDVIYDSANDAMLQRVDPSPFTVPGGGSVNAEQKIARIAANGSSLLLTWDFKLGPGVLFTDVGDLAKHKAYRLDYGDGSFWLSWKTDYAKGRKDSAAAEVFMSAGTKEYLGPGTTNTNGEILEPRLGEFYARVNVWTRYWFYIEGTIGGGPGVSPVYISCWAADETREPVQLYNRLAMYTPLKGITDFRFEFNSSQAGADNDMMEIWNRNLVALQGVSPTEVKSLLQKPVR